MRPVQWCRIFIVCLSVCVCVCVSVCLLDTDERGSTQTCWSHYTRRHLRSANRHLLAVPRFRLNTHGRRAFSVAGPMAWNSLRDFIRDPTSSTDCFRRLLKRTCSRVTSASSALAVLDDYALYTSTHSLSHPHASDVSGTCLGQAYKYYDARYTLHFKKSTS